MLNYSSFARTVCKWLNTHIQSCIYAYLCMCIFVGAPTFLHLCFHISVFDPQYFCIYMSACVVLQYVSTHLADFKYQHQLCFQATCCFGGRLRKHILFQSATIRELKKRKTWGCKLRQDLMRPFYNLFMCVKSYDFCHSAKLNVCHVSALTILP